MIDSHCHLQTEQFDLDRETVINDAVQAGVEGFIVPAIDYASFPATLTLANAYKNIWCGLGIHPHSATEWNSDVKADILDKSEKNVKVVAVGEIGLDYYYDFAPRDVQIKAFTEQIEVAQLLQKPIIIHTRDSIGETLQIVREYYSQAPREYPFGQFHCFTGTPEQAEQVVNLGFAVSFTGNITFKNSTLAPTVCATPMESMLIETDSPYLSPAPFRGKRNTPAMVRRVAEKIAELTQRDVIEVMNITKENAKRIFRLSAVFSVLILSLCFGVTNSSAQVGSRPPDSVMTQQRKEAEELVRKQRDELLKEQDKRRQDSIAAANQQQIELQREAQEQARKDSLKAIERAQDEEHQRELAQTPITWKAIGIGGGLGVGNLSELGQALRKTLSPTSVLAWSLSASTAITKGIDFNLSYNSFTIGDSLVNDKLYRPSQNSGVKSITDTLILPHSYYVPIHEQITTSYFSFDFRFVIDPHSPVKFYLGAGYDLVKIENKQDYFMVPDSLHRSRTSSTQILSVDSSFSRGGINVLFGAHYDLEITDNLILTPFAEISASFLFSGAPQSSVFDFRVPSDPITFTHLNVGATLYFGWFKVKRD